MSRFPSAHDGSAKHVVTLGEFLGRLARQERLWRMRQAALRTARCAVPALAVLAAIFFLF
jgi:hypothetical protein